MKNARAKRAKMLFFIVKYANLWGFCCRRRRGCLSSLLRASFHLRDPGIKVLEDYPQDIIELRRKQVSKLKVAKKNGMKIFFSKAESNKLYINGKFVPV